MNNVIDKKNCTGCTACMNICPKKAITMHTEEEGFKFPIINREKCINCGLCRRVCPVINTKFNASLNICYVAYSKDVIERLNSSSGAIFTLLANTIIDDGGIVIGAGFDNNNQLKHIAVERKEDLDILRKSKYLQSDLNDIFKYVKGKIKNKKVLFVGTPCQIAGLKSFIKDDFENLVCVDLFCHGVPSPKLFDKYVKELETKNNDKMIKYDFRDNSSGWDNYSNTAFFKNKKITQLRVNNDYMKLFLSNVALRESCFNCNFKLGNKYSDITLGDFWGVKRNYPEMYNKEGVSAIIINTEKGKKYFEIISNNLEYRECSIDIIISGNSSLVKSCIRQNKRDLFFDDLDNNSINQLVNKYVVKVSFSKRIINKIKKIIKH